MKNIEQINHSIKLKENKLRKINLILKSGNVTIKKDVLISEKKKLKDSIDYLKSMKSKENKNSS